MIVAYARIPTGLAFCMVVACLECSDTEGIALPNVRAFHVMLPQADCSSGACSVQGVPIVSGRTGNCKLPIKSWSSENSCLHSPIKDASARVKTPDPPVPFASDYDICLFVCLFVCLFFVPWGFSKWKWCCNK